MTFLNSRTPCGGRFGSVCLGICRFLWGITSCTESTLPSKAVNRRNRLLFNAFPLLVHNRVYTSGMYLTAVGQFPVLSFH